MARCLAIFLAAFFLAFPSVSFSMASHKPSPTTGLEEKRLEGQLPAPDFPGHLEWLNAERKISLQELKGKIVLLDFWTYCCINCMHALAELKKLEEKYPNELVVIGVHSAKFTNEKENEAIRQAILRYEIKHPVINDKDLELWNEYGVNAWPTLVLINPAGKIIGAQSGEDVFDLFDPLIEQTVEYFDRKGQLDRRPLKLVLEETKRPANLLSFPGKVWASAEKKLLFISDSNHNRILAADLNGQVQEVIGSGEIGQADGSFEKAEFHHPQGIYLQGNLLFIADTENHLIRTADLKTREVKTLFGTGKQARRLSARGKGTEVPLNSPWDLLVHQNKLYIAMAGSHQIYAADLQTLEIAPYAGSGREARVDGTLQEAALAQPSGITTDGSKLYFADSEISSVRSADLNLNGNVETLIGDDLFEFGDIDGTIQTARLQHPLGIHYEKGLLYVADTYNSKIKIIDPVQKTSQTYAGTGKQGSQNGALKDAQFFEPGGLTFLDQKIYVADTNNHLIRVIDQTSGRVSTLEISGLEQKIKPAAKPFKGRDVRIPLQTLKAGRGVFSIIFKLPQGYKFNYEAPFHMQWKSQEKAVRFAKDSQEMNGNFHVPIEIPVEAHLGNDELTGEAIVYYCRDASSVCFFDLMKIHVPIEITESGSSQISLQVDILPKS